MELFKLIHPSQSVRFMTFIAGILFSFVFWISGSQCWAVEPTNKMAFWKTQRKGANQFCLRPPGDDWWKAAKKLGIQFVRLTPSKWKGAGKDFLMGSADDYRGLTPEDLKLLRGQLDLAEKYDIKVVLTMLTLPGARWRQHNNNVGDPRLWTQHHFWAQTALFWRDLAQALKNHSAIVGYDLLNEPHPTRILLKKNKLPEKNITLWKKKLQGGLGDINHFYQLLMASIRSVDTETPVILESDSFASSEEFPLLSAVSDASTLYSFHFYDPWEFTTLRVNQSRFSYPGKMPADEGNQTKEWTIKELRSFLKPVIKWAQQNSIPANRILVGEFGCDRRISGVKEYLSDLISLFNTMNWHWAFYSYREDEWPGMDYELGTGPVPAGYWEEKAKGKNVPLPRVNQPLFDIFRKEFSASSTLPLTVKKKKVKP